MGESTAAPYYKAAGAVLHHGEALAVLRSLPEHSVDALVTDPPYSGIADGRSANSKYQTTKTPRYPEFAGDNRDQRSYFIWWTLWGTECLRLLKPGAPVLVFSDWRQYPVVSDALQVAGFVWRGTLAWDKTRGAIPTRGRFRQQAEFILWGSAGPFPKRDGVGARAGVFSCAPLAGGRHHVVGKPVALMEQLVEICPPGGWVLDPFAGSGSTGVGCLNTGRRFLGVELSADYAAIAARRLREAAAKSSKAA